MLWHQNKTGIWPLHARYLSSMIALWKQVHVYGIIWQWVPEINLWILAEMTIIVLIQQFFYTEISNLLKIWLTMYDLKGMSLYSSQRLAKDIIANDPKHIGNRGPKRWSLGSASKTGHLLHDIEWAKLVDLPTITPILKVRIFANFCLPWMCIRN